MALTTTACSSFSSAGPLPTRQSHPASRPVSAVRIVAATDIGAVMTTLLLVLTRGTSDQWPAGLTGLLARRITVQDAGLLAIFAVLVLLVFEAVGLYEAARVRRWIDEAGRVFLGTTAAAALAGVALTTGYAGVVDRAALLHFWAGSFAAVAAARAARAWVTRAASPCRRAIVVGSGPHALRVCRELSTDPFTSYRVLGFVDTSSEPRSTFVARRTLGSLDRLEDILIHEHVDEVHVGLPVKSHYAQIQETIRVCERVGVKLVYDADIFGTALAQAHVDRASGPTPRVELRVVSDGMAAAIKRVLDVAGATMALILLSPLMIVTAAAIKLTSKGPAIFAQERYGLNRSRFRMLKFRTMVQNAEHQQASLEALNEAQGPVFKIARDPRITPTGRWLRRTSIDELPQLINVLRGEMSLIGPRPLPLRDVLKFTRSADMRRFSVRPGLSGLWQVSGRSGLGFDQWITLDLHYIDHWSLALDFTILARTIPAVLRGTGAA